MSNQELLSEINKLKETIKKLEQEIVSLKEQKSTDPNCYLEAITLATNFPNPRILGNEHMINKLLDDEILHKPYTLSIGIIDCNTIEGYSLADARTLLLRHGYRFQYESRMNSYNCDYLIYTEVWMKGT